MTLEELLDTLNGIHRSLPDGENVEVVVAASTGHSVHTPRIDIFPADDDHHIMVIA